MSSTLPEPDRWADRPPDDATVEGAIGTSLRHVRRATEAMEPAPETIVRALEMPPRRARAVLAWRLAFAVALLISMGGFVGAARYVWHIVRPAPRSELAPAAVPAERRPRPAAPAARIAVPELAPDEAPPAPEAPAPVPSGPPPRSLVHRVPRPPAPPELAAAPPAEAEVLATAFRELRSNGDAAAALRALDGYDLRFPAGVMRDEARIARAEALMIEDRRADALRLLSTFPDDDPGLTRNVRITRGELFAEAGRCADAIRDFERVLVIADDDAVGGRALYGRASCRLAAGQLAAARVDLERYLSRQADGPLAPAARRALESLP